MASAAVPLRVFIGYDAREAVAYHVCAHSILTRATIPVTISPLVQPALRASGLYWRERGPTESTEFSLTRFLVPSLCGHAGDLAVYLDCDMLIRADLRELVTLAEEQPWKAVMVVQHDYAPRTATKMGGRPQTTYPRKNWSSMMVFRPDRCRALSPGYVNRASGLDLHRFAWCADEEIGGLPREWNHLVGEYPPNPGAKILHYTLGGPFLAAAPSGGDHDREWLEERDQALGAPPSVVTAPASERP